MARYAPKPPCKQNVDLKFALVMRLVHEIFLTNNKNDSCLMKVLLHFFFRWRLDTEEISYVMDDISSHLFNPK